MNIVSYALKSAVLRSAKRMPGSLYFSGGKKKIINIDEGNKSTVFTCCSYFSNDIMETKKPSFTFDHNIKDNQQNSS